MTPTRPWRERFQQQTGFTDEQMERARADRTLARLPVLHDPVIHAMVADLEDAQMVDEPTERELTAAELEALERRHVATTGTPEGWHGPYCRANHGEPWPCDARRLLDHLAAVRGERDALALEVMGYQVGAAYEKGVEHTDAAYGPELHRLREMERLAVAVLARFDKDLAAAFPNAEIGDHDNAEVAALRAALRGAGAAGPTSA